MVFKFSMFFLEKVLVVQWFSPFAEKTYDDHLLLLKNSGFSMVLMCCCCKTCVFQLFSLAVAEKHVLLICLFLFLFDLFSYVFPMVFLCCSYVVPIVVLCFS